MTSSPAQTSIRRHLVACAAVLTLCGGVAGWASGTEVSGAVIAPGLLAVDSFVKKVQHQTGGIVKEIAVAEGDTVHEGQVLLRFDETLARANLAVITNELDELLAGKARNEAERAGFTTIRFPRSLVARAEEPEVAALLEGVRKQFESGVAARAGQRAQLRERLTQLHMQQSGLAKQLTAKQRETELVSVELVAVRDLWQKKLVQLTRISTLERDEARADGETGQISSAIGEIGSKLAETELQILQIDQDLSREAEKELEGNRARTAELIERKIAANNQLALLEVRAPQAGVVHELSVHTIGGVVTPQQDTIMLIVPVADDLKVDAKIQPQDVDQIRIGEPVHVRLSGLNQRTTPELNGTVLGLSPDSVNDPKTGASYFKARIGFLPGETARLGSVKLVAGMPGEVFIQTSAPRTIISYLTKPLRDQMTRAFR